MKNKTRNNCKKLQDICFSAIINDHCRFCTFKENVHVTKCIHNDLNLYHQLFIDDMKLKKKNMKLYPKNIN